jgi:hypothetical protein
MTMTDLSQEFGVSIVHVDGHSNVRVTGEIDLATATELRQRLNCLSRRAPATSTSTSPT